MTVGELQPRGLTVLDLDGVVVDFARGYTELARHRFSSDIGVHSGGSHRYWNFFDDPDLHVTKDQDSKMWPIIAQSAYFWQSLPGLYSEGDLFELRQLAQVSDILYLTNRGGIDVEEQTKRWLLEHRFPAGQVMISSEKGKVLEEVDQPILGVLDDRPEHIVDMYDHGISVYVMDRPYNRILSHFIPRVSSVAEFCRLMQDEAAELAGSSLVTT